MKFFIDTANLQQIREAKDFGILDGVTTNPSLVMKEGISRKDLYNHYKTICEIVDKGDVSAEVLSTDLQGMITEGNELSKIHKNIVIKLPMTESGLKAIQYFTTVGIKTNCTLVFSAGQAILAAKSGATYVSPFVGRIDDNLWDGMQLIEQILKIYNAQQFATQVLVASVRSTQHIIKAAEMGAHASTAQLDIILALLKHTLTDIGLAKFVADSKHII